jgi:hypothetical protein
MPQHAFDEFVSLVPQRLREARCNRASQIMRREFFG